MLNDDVCQMFVRHEGERYSLSQSFNKMASRSVAVRVWDSCTQIPIKAKYLQSTQLKFNNTLLSLKLNIHYLHLTLS